MSYAIWEKLFLERLFAQLEPANSSCVYARLKRAGHSDEEIAKNPQLCAPYGYKNPRTIITDGKKIYTWVTSGDLSTMSKTNKRDPKNAKAMLKRLLAQTDDVKVVRLIESRLAALEAFEKAMNVQ